MALGDAYVVKADFKARLNITTSDQDTVIDQTLAAASRYVDSECGQEFNKSATATAKVFTARFPDAIELPNLVSVSELATDNGTRLYESIWAGTDYDLYPFDAADRNVPYTEIRRSPLGVYSWPFSVKGVRITGIWGWPAVPSAITQATMRVAERVWALSRAPLGLQGAGEFSMPIASGDADVARWIAPFRVLVIA